MAKYINTDKPNIHILSIEDDQSGNPKFSYEVNDAFIVMIKREKKIDEVNEKVISEYITELLDNCATNKNGYGYEKVNSTKKIIDN